MLKSKFKFLTISLFCIYGSGQVIAQESGEFVDMPIVPVNSANKITESDTPKNEVTVTPLDDSGNKEVEVLPVRPANPIINNSRQPGKVIKVPDGEYVAGPTAEERNSIVPSVFPLKRITENVTLKDTAKPKMADTIPAGETIVELPAVPRNVLTKNVPRPISDAEVNKEKGNSVRSAGSTNNYSTIGEGSVIYAQFGINQIVPVGVEHLNRIITPFAVPTVQTSSTAKTSIKDNVIYVGTDVEKPVTMFIHEEGNQNNAISLTLVPQRIPPREIIVRFPDNYAGADGGFQPTGTPKAEKWEKSQPYVEAIKNLFRTLALGELPQGYQISRTPRNLTKPVCAMPGIKFDFNNGQYIAGKNLAVFVGVATNISGQALEIKENVCGNWDTAAVSAYPRNVLNSGERTEMYVAIRQGQRKTSTTRRPSLIGEF